MISPRIFYGIFDAYKQIVHGVNPLVTKEYDNRPVVILPADYYEQLLRENTERGVLNEDFVFEPLEWRIS